MDRWALKLQGYRFDIEHVAGKLNLWANLLGRWGAKQVEKKERIAIPVKLKAMEKRKHKRQLAKLKVKRVNSDIKALKKFYL